MIYEPKVTLVDTEFVPDRTTVIGEVKLSDKGLEMVVESKEWAVKVHFDALHGFRVLDEGDLSEFWSECNLQMGWLFKVKSGGWNYLEKTRDHFVTGKLYEPVEFLIIGLNECVSVLGFEMPNISQTPLSNSRSLET